MSKSGGKEYVCLTLADPNIVPRKVCANLELVKGRALCPLPESQRLIPPVMAPARRSHYTIGFYEAVARTFLGKLCTIGPAA